MANIEELLEDQKELKEMQIQLYETLRILMDNQNIQANQESIVINNQGIIIKNQQTIVDNQVHIITNQKSIVDNQLTLSVILAAQKEIILNLSSLSGENKNATEINEYFDSLYNSAKSQSNVSKLEDPTLLSS